MPGYSRGGATAAEGSTGGFAVAWSEENGGHRIVVRRILDLDGLPLDDAPYVIGTGTTSERLRSPVVYVAPPNGGNALMEHAYFDTGQATIFGGPLLCAP